MSAGPRRSTRPHGGGAVHHRAQEPVEQRDTQALDQAQHSQAQVRDHVRLLDERGKQVPLQNAAHEENCRAVQQGDEALEGQVEQGEDLYHSILDERAQEGVVAADPVVTPN